MLCPDISGVTTQIYCFNCVSDSLPQILFSPEHQIKSTFPRITAECIWCSRRLRVAQAPAVLSVTPECSPRSPSPLIAPSSSSALGEREKEEGFRVLDRKGCCVPRCTRSFLPDANLGLSFFRHQLSCSVPGASGLPAVYPLDASSISLVVTTRTCLHMLPQPLVENHFWICPLAMFPMVFNKFFNSSLRVLMKPSPTTCPGA